MSASLHDRQAAAGRQGAEFEKAVEILLLCQNWTIQERHWREPTINVEIDFVATDPSGETWWIECKGSWESPTGNGLERTDTLKKAIGSAALLRLLDERNSVESAIERGELHAVRVGGRRLVPAFAIDRLLGLEVAQLEEKIERLKAVGQ